MKECRALSLANLVAYMEKEKSKLRKLKRSYRKKRKQDEACRINKLFQLDPERVFSDFKKIIVWYPARMDQESTDLIRYKHTHGLNQDTLLRAAN